jgi:hypothetical protein
MRLSLKDDLPFISINLSFAGQTAKIEDILVDTGSASTILAADAVSVIQLTPQPTDELRIIRGVGGTEIVFSRVVDFVAVSDMIVPSFEIEVGGMDYGFPVNGILGMDFLNKTGAIINLRDLQIEFAGEQ